jgi:small conductance mechanosensitive channel
MSRLESMFGITWAEFNQIILKIGLNLVLAIAILVIGFWLAKMAGKTIKRLMNKSGMDAGLITFVASLTTTILKVLVIVTAITQLGVQMTSFIAILGAAGLAIGMAFSGTLSNFAGGVMILVFKPFKVGESIQAHGESGKVVEIAIFHTTILTADNKTVIIPNGPLANGNIINFARAGSRRVDMIFGFGYGEDYNKAKEIIEKIIENEPRILKDRDTFIGLNLLPNSTINVVVRPWVNVDDYWPVHFDVNEKVYKEFAANGIKVVTT